MWIMDQKTLKDLVKRRHPEYDSMLKHWEFLESTYYGGRGWFDKNIFRYHKEGDGEFKARIERAYRFNHTREVVDLVNKYLFRAPIARKESAPECLQRFWKSSTKSGLSANEFSRLYSLKSSIFGRIWVVIDTAAPSHIMNALEVESEIDSDSSAEPILTVEDAEQITVYAYTVSPIDVLDYSQDEDGELNWVLIREMYRDDEDPFESSGKVRARYRLWDRTHWHLITPDEKEKNFDYSSGTHNLGVVPVVPVDNQITGTDDESPALIADIAYLDRACANYVSNLDAIIQDQTFSQLTLPAQGILPGDDTDTKMVEAGTKRIFTYDASGGGKPEFISPDPKQANLIMGTIRQIIAEIYNSVGLAGENTKQDNSKGIDNSSGVAKSKDFERVNALLISKADSLELAENRIARIVCLWSGEEDFDVDSVQYSDNFDVRELYDEFYIAMQLALVQMPKGTRKEQMKQIIHKLFPYMAEEKMEELIKEVDSWEPMEEQQASDALSKIKSRFEGEAKRDRETAGLTQSKTKQRTVGADNNALTE